ncbi:MAG: hypothetical protein ACK42Z_03770 [Candidatus Kapaibacteriota bacterium]
MYDGKHRSPSEVRVLSTAPVPEFAEGLLPPFPIEQRRVRRAIKNLPQQPSHF